MNFAVLDLRRSTFNECGFFSFDPVEPVFLGELPTCPFCGVGLGPKPWLPPFKVKLVGDRPGDVCASGYGRKFLASPRFIEMCSKEGIEGLDFCDDPVEVINLGTESSVSYFVVRPVNVLTHLDEEASGLRVHNLIGCNRCRVAQRTRVERIQIDERTWEGEDIFCPSGLYGTILVTSRFSEAIERHKISNVHLIPGNEYSETKQL